jgi:curved DNA-binding protein CbpA
MPDAPDPYLVLGVARGATKAQIKAAHRALAKRFHPDGATGDAHRFRQVHEAYQLLADPLRRREWDARHAPGPVRADEPTRPASRRRPARSPEPGASRDAPRQEPAARTYRWSASEVPWWEEGARSDGRRQPGARRSRPAAGVGGAGPEAPPARATADFEVYNRSSGAAWSSAARQYFRHFEAELPRRGQFRQQGGQPLTAARARVAAEEEARARSSQAPPAQPAASPRQAPAAQPGARSRPARPARPVPPATAEAMASDTPRAAAPSAARPRPSYAHAAGIVHSAEQVSAARAATERARNAAAWPNLRQRLVDALLAWLPLALLIAYAGSAATGCDRAAASCPAWYGPAQTVVIALVLGLLVALPRVAFVGAVASLATLAAGALLVGVLALARQQPPLPPSLAGAGALILAATYLLAVSLVALNRRFLPWVVHR